MGKLTNSLIIRSSLCFKQVGGHSNFNCLFKSWLCSGNRSISGLVQCVAKTGHTVGDRSLFYFQGFMAYKCSQ